ncbi:MAG: CPBP family intramembrane metalloprotease [bacterium]|nr:CPBP family intramembrane metalloprotease [bacterium]
MKHIKLQEILRNRFILFMGVLLLFFLSSLFQIIPIKLFNIDPANITDSQQIYLTLFSNFILALILIIIFRKSIKEDFKKLKKNFFTIFDKSFTIWIIGLTCMATFNIIINKFFPTSIANNEETIKSMITVNPVIMLLSTSIFAPIIEELVFRKGFRIAIKNNFAFVLISGLVFGALHVVLSIQSIYDYLYILPYCSLGIAFSYIYYKTDNIYAPIMIHMIHNFLITLLNIYALGIGMIFK